MNEKRLQIRPETRGDEEGIRRVHCSAFPSDAESRLVDALRESGRLMLSLVGEQEGEIVGHVAFSPVTLNETETGWGLAPVGVLPESQRQGIGQRLIQEGLRILREREIPCVVVLGDPAYYCRFGFEPAGRWNLRDEYGGGDAFQAMELVAGGIPASGGVVRYSREFGLFA